MSELIIPVVALGSMGVVFAAILGFASDYFAVPVDETQEKVREVLPGANCGACGFPGCDGFAQAVAEGKAPLNGCTIGGSEVAGKVASIMGGDVESTEKMVAMVMCQGTSKHTSENFDYQGKNDCRTIASLGGNKSCQYGCIGCGTCVDQCEFDALQVIDGVAVIDKEKCVACKKCISVCPKDLIQLVPYKQSVTIKCNNKDFGKVVKDNCSIGCIGCGICARLAPNEFELEGKLARVKNSDEFDIEKAKMAAEKCPAKCIKIDEEEVIIS